MLLAALLSKGDNSILVLVDTKLPLLFCRYRTPSAVVFGY